MRLCLLILAIIFSQSLFAAEGGIEMKSVKININNKASLQRGAQLYMNYCSGCHSLKYLRYSSLGQGLGLTTFDGQLDKDLLENNLIFTSASIMDPIKIAMPPEDARQWFGRMPPDLTLTGREKGPDWIFTYLKSFYKDSSRPFGANNLLMPDVSMPNVLAPLQGEVIAQKKDEEDGSHVRLVLVEQGAMTQQQFDSALQDLVNFLVYVSEPHKLTRYAMGLWVLLFLVVFTVLAYFLKKSYWNNI